MAHTWDGTNKMVDGVVDGIYICIARYPIELAVDCITLNVIRYMFNVGAYVRNKSLRCLTQFQRDHLQALTSSFHPSIKWYANNTMEEEPSQLALWIRCL